MSERTFAEWMEHEFPDLFDAPRILVHVSDTDQFIGTWELTRATWDHLWHEVHRRVKPGNVVAIAISQECNDATRHVV